MTEWGRLSPKACRSVAAATHRINLWEGSVRSMKTVASLFAWTDYLVSADCPGGLGLVAGKTRDTVERNVVDPLRSLFGGMVHYVRGTGELRFMGKRFVVVGANDDGAQDRIRGTTFAHAYLDEVTVLPASFFRMATNRLSLAGARMYGTTNPDNPRHWLMVDYLDHATVWLQQDGTMVHRSGSMDLARFSFNLHDNPYLPAEYIKGLYAENIGLWLRRFVLGEWVAGEGAIYDTFDPDGDMVADRLPRSGFAEWWIAVDYGTVNPFVAALMGRTIHDQLWVVSEYRWDSVAEHRQRTDAEYAAEMARWLRGVARRLKLSKVEYDRLWVDPSAASFIATLTAKNWDRVRRARNNVDDGIRHTAALLNADRLRFYEPGMNGGLDEMAGYVWDPKAQERGEDRPVKAHDHFPDTLRYLVNGTRSVWRPWLTEAAMAGA